MIASEQVDAGQAIYTKRNLALYDLVVHGISNRFIWKCPTRQLVAHYNQHITGNHLDVGVGTGYFLEHCRFATPTPRIGLMDLNPHALEHASRRISRYRPEIYRRNVLEPIPFEGQRFDSVGINYLLHCLPGTLPFKAVTFDHLRGLLNPNGVIFGSTLLQGGVVRNWAARGLMGVYNRKGVFSNGEDDLTGLKRELEKRFEDFSIEVVGCAALFAARV